MMTNNTHARKDLYQTVTDRIVAAIEAGAPTFQMPWHCHTAGTLPVNVDTQNAYRGINILSLWVSQLNEGYSTSIWGTYKQWQSRGAQVRKGERSHLVVFYKEIEREVIDTATNETKPGKYLLARASFVFNADQVQGYTVPGRPAFEDKTHVLDDVGAFVDATKAVVLHGGTRACYRPGTDTILMPERSLFTGTATSTPTESYYSTLCHELTHWTGHKSRLDRDLSTRFGEDAYAMEELIAELGAAFLCASLGISAEPRLDHAAYLAHWLTVLKADKKALFTAASKASGAAEYLKSLQPASQEAAA